MPGSSPDPGVMLISTRSELEPLVRRLEGALEVAFDTEFHGERSYWPKLMLVQIGTKDEVALIDPLAPQMSGAVEEFMALLAERGTVIVGHDLRCDLEIFNRVAGRLPRRVFDTQIAASFLGMGPSIGLGNLVHTRAGVELPKDHCMADWSRRPLPREQMTYAANDVRYLLKVADVLRRQVEEAGRGAWVEEECSLLLDPAGYEPADPARNIKNVRRRPAAGTRAAVLLEQLAVEREALALKSDRRPRHILPDDVMVDLAKRAPTEPSELVGQTNRRRPQGLTRFGDRWIKAIRRGLELPISGPSPLPSKLHDSNRAFVGLMRLFVQSRMLALDLAPSLVMNRIQKGMYAIVRDPPAGKEAFIEALGLAGWRCELFADPLWALYRGKLRPVVRHGDAGPSVSWELD